MIMRQKNRLALAGMLFGYAFLYIPIVVLVVFSFNGGKQVTVWGGFSLKWYRELLQNEAILTATLISLKIALMSATLATVLGTLAALIITRFKHFMGKGFFKGIIALPLVMPEVIIGLAFLLFFVSLERALDISLGGGVATITLAHATIAMAYVASIVKVQLAQFDNTLIEAAQDLGATPTKAFFVITLPLIMPSMFAGWLLAFILSLDDVVVASFLAGPEATTLPMLVFSSLRFGITPQLNALATIIIVTLATGIILAAWIHLRRRK
jgi:putrescine transport system permease protein